MDELLSAGFIHTVGQFLYDYPLISYLILAAGIVIRGELTMFLGVYLVMLGYISWPTLIIAAFLTLLIGDNLVYGAGWFLGRSAWRSKIEAKWPLFEKLRGYVTRHTIKLIFLAKFTMGLTLIIISATGWARVSFKKFFIVHLIAITIWMCFISGLAYSLISGLGYLQGANVLKNIEIFLLVFIVAIFTAEYFLQRALKRDVAFEEKLANFGSRIKSRFNGENKKL